MPQALTDLQYRSQAFLGDSYGERRKNVIAATENPVPMYDKKRNAIIPEILLMSGARVPERLPLLDSHNMRATAAVVGSAFLKTAGREMVGTIEVSASENGLWTKINEGHIGDVSIGYHVEKSQYVPPGKTETINGRSYEGPVNVATKWQVFELSITPIGADEQAKMRGLQRVSAGMSHASREGVSMDPFIRSLCEAAGMPTDLADDVAEQWRAAHQDDLLASAKLVKEPESGFRGKTVEAKTGGEGSQTRHSSQVDFEELKRQAAEQAMAEARKIFQQEIEARAAHQKACRELGAKYSLTAAESDEIAAATTDLAGARSSVLDRLAERQRDARPGPSYAMPNGTNQASREKLSGMAVTALSVRALSNNGCDASRHIPEATRPKGWEQMRYWTLPRLAEECARHDGHDTYYESNERIAQLALGFNTRAGGGGDPAFHVSASLPSIVLDAINKTLLAAYNERQMTWEKLFTRGESAKDFKTLYRIRFGDGQQPTIWPDNTSISSSAINSERESYAVEAYATSMTFSWRLIVNDDMSALTRVPVEMGKGFKRLINTLAWTQITSNPTMGYDSVAAFSAPTGNRKQDNYMSSGAITDVNLGVARKKLRLMTGINTVGGNASEQFLYLEPKWLVGPAALEGTILKYCSNQYTPEANLFQQGNQYSGLVPIIEPLLDAASATGWYMFSPDIPFLEVTFLQGHEAGPIITTSRDEKNMSLEYTAIQAAAAKIIDHRSGIYSVGT